MDLVYKFVLFSITITLVSCENCEPVTIESCSTAGYKLTARFPNVDGQPYQDTQASRLNIYIPLLQPCSKFASTILCSLYVPKCEEGRNTPWIPCRDVCQKFVADCATNLRQVGLAGLFTTLCDLLPVPDNSSQPKNCFSPSNFNSSSSGGNLSFAISNLLAYPEFNKLCINIKIMQFCGMLTMTSTIDVIFCVNDKIFLFAKSILPLHLKGTISPADLLS